MAHLLTDLRSGATVSLCEEDYGPGLIPILASELGVDAQALYSHVEKFLKAEAKKAEKELETAKAAAAEDTQRSGPSADDDHQGDAADDQGGMSEVYGRSAPDGGELV